MVASTQEDYSYRSCPTDIKGVPWELRQMMWDFQTKTRQTWCCVIIKLTLILIYAEDLSICFC